MKPAGFWIRFLAYLIDGFIIGIPLSIIQMILSLVFLGSSLMYYDPYADELQPEMFVGYMTVAIISIILSILSGILYYGLMTSSKHQGTLGKKILGLKVVNEAGEQVSKGQAIGRYFAYILSGIIFYIGFIMIAFGKKRGLHDFICNTYVVYKE